MSDPNGSFQQRLLAIFAEEARGHLAHIGEGLIALEGAEAAQRPAGLEAVLKTLHTLKGAARSVDLDHLERLCHALEGLCGVLRRAPGLLGATEFDLLHRALTLARELAGTPSGRTLNRALALCAELDRAAADAQAATATATDAHVAAGAAPAPDREFLDQEVPDHEAPEDEAPDQAPAGPALPALLRVDAAQLDAIRTEAEALLAAELSLQHQAGELRALAAALAQQRRAGAADATAPELQCARLAQSLGAACQGLAGTRQRLMQAVLETALVPFSEALDELPSLVRKLARGRGLEVTLTIEGAGVRIDRRLLGVIREALIHMATNAVDHGIEPPDARLAAGKSAVGSLKIAVSQPDARHVLLELSDDGAGFDGAALARAAGLSPSESARLDERARLALALRAGVSTRSEVTPVSGRGIGLSIVADKVAAAGGTLALDSTPGAGSRFELLLPVSLASQRALVVTCGGQRYAVPLAALQSVRALGPDDTGMVEDRETVVEQGRVLPLVRLATLAGAPDASGPAKGVALLVGGARPFGLLVDEILTEQDILPRGLGPLLQRVRHVSGATQLGDGALVPVLAMDDIAGHASGAMAAAPASPPAGAHAGTGRATRVLVAEDSLTSRLLLKHILEGAGCEVETAPDGLAALSLLRHRSFDAVVSDVEMPQLDGLALTARIRAEPKTAELPVILVTSLQTPAERERGLQAGADAYLTKGAFDHDQLLAALRRLT